MVNNIELSSLPGSMACNWELFKKRREEERNLAPIDLLASLGGFDDELESGRL